MPKKYHALPRLGRRRGKFDGGSLVRLNGDSCFEGQDAHKSNHPDKYERYSPRTGTLHTFMHIRRFCRISEAVKCLFLGTYRESTRTGTRTQDQLVKSKSYVIGNKLVTAVYDLFLPLLAISI